MQELRKDVLTAQKVETGLVFRQMLGIDDARQYMREEQVPELVVERVLTEQATRNGEARPVTAVVGAALWHSGLAQGFYCNGGRRRDVVRAAIVEAALTVREQLGVERAERLLQKEELSADVIARVLAEDGAARRGRPEREAEAGEGGPMQSA